MHKHKLVQCLKPVPRAVSEETLEVVFSSLCSGVGSQLAETALQLFREKKYAELVNLEINPRSYANAQAYADDQLIIKFLSKYPNFKHENLKPLEAAMETFDSGEESCRATNKKFAELELDPSKEDPLMHSILQSARRKIAKVLGRPNLNRIARGFGWGPGANTSSSGKHTSAYNKFRNRLDVTSNCLIMGHCCINSTPSWVNCQLQTDSYPSVEVSLMREALNIVRGNEIVFVPKNAKTKRTIAKEPSVNSYVQKGFGSEMRRCLALHAGIDLTHGQEVNQRLALEGSLTGLLSTIDLKNASGTISQGIVKRLIRSDWYALLDMARSKQGWHPEKKCWIYYQQFSSMGNAFTFELETLIFWGICKAVAEVCNAEVVSVYGDDLIIEAKAYDETVKVLNYCGFTVNETKSFKDGPFRESCGKDYFVGTEVRPIYLKESLTNVQSIYKLANSIRRYSHRRNLGYGCDNRFHAAWLYCFSRVDEPLRFLIPEGKGDPGFISNFDEAAPYLKRPKARSTWEGFSFQCLVDTPVKAPMRDEHAAYVAYLSAAGSEEPFLGSYNLRKMTSPRVNTSHTHCWYDLGPWC